MELLLRFLGRKPIGMKVSDQKKKMQVDHQKGKKVLLTVSTDVVDSTPEETLRDEKEKIT